MAYKLADEHLHLSFSTRSVESNEEARQNHLIASTG